MQMCIFRLNSCGSIEFHAGFKYHRYFQPVLTKAGLRKIRLHDLRQHADFLIMPTTNWEQQFGGARALPRVGIIKGFPGRLTAYRQVGSVLV